MKIGKINTNKIMISINSLTTKKDFKLKRKIWIQNNILTLKIWKIIKNKIRFIMKNKIRNILKYKIRFIMKNKIRNITMNKIRKNKIRNILKYKIRFIMKNKIRNITMNKIRKIYTDKKQEITRIKKMSKKTNLL